jgi:hypothetical protein
MVSLSGKHRNQQVPRKPLGVCQIRVEQAGVCLIPPLSMLIATIPTIKLYKKISLYFSAFLSYNKLEALYLPKNIPLHFTFVLLSSRIAGWGYKEFVTKVIRHL